MTMVKDREVERWNSDQLGARLVELHDQADEALREAEAHEIKAKSLRCDADRYKREAEEIMKFRCPRFDLKQDR